MAINISIQKYNQEGDMAPEYQALRNILDKEDNEVKPFRTKDLEIDLNNPLNIECQPSYDGTVNLIINDDKNAPRIINTRFSKLENDRYKVISRNQLEQTNLYRAESIDQQTRLFRNINLIPKIDLMSVMNSGQLKGGNYTFYIKLADSDTNKTDIVCESGQVSVFKGDLAKISSISGTLLNELTDKSINLKVSNIDTTFAKLYLYFSREYSDTNGIRMSEAGMLTKPYDIKGETLLITISGYEEVTPISIEELNIQYNVVTAAKTQAQVQNMLFLGNVQQNVFNIKDLQNISYFIGVSVCKSDESIGWVDPQNYNIKEDDDTSQSEYYNPNNIYYRLGYWPDELYRLGVVYIMKDDSLSPVFNLRGCEFTSVDGEYEKTSNNLSGRDNTSLFTLEGEKKKMNYLDRNDFISGGQFLDNTFGVFKMPFKPIQNYGQKEINPLYFKIKLSPDVLSALNDLGVKGYFIVRQKRIPTILAQGFTIGVDTTSYTPMVKCGPDYYSEMFLSKSGLLTQTFDDHLRTTQSKASSALLCMDANVNKVLQSSFNGGDFVLQPTGDSSGEVNKEKRHFYLNSLAPSPEQRNHHTMPLVYVNSDTPYKYINGYSFATRCGAAEDVSQFSFFGKTDYRSDNYDLVRGIYCPILGVGGSLTDSNIYNIKIPNYSVTKMKDYFQIRGNNQDSFFAISDRYMLPSNTDNAVVIDVYRGDCFTNTVTIRLNRNFIDSEVPVNEYIINNRTWKDNYKGYSNMKKTNPTEEEKESSNRGYYENMNRADINTVNLGMWVTYKCLSSYNLGLRAEDPSYVDEYALMGSARGFYPLQDMAPVVAHKIEESWLLNEGYGATVGQKRHFIASDVPYIQELFDNRIMFSNVQTNGDIKNAYRIFQGLDYKDIERQYGAIVKFLPLDNNIFCVFEHGLGIIPINEKALLATQSGQSIHMYGAGVLQNQISLISADFGSIWSESIVRTPIGIYGVDTYAKKIWVYSSSGGLKIISDMKVQKFLNDNITLKELDKYPIIGIKNVKTHYNNYKGDVMFTFYNDNPNTTWNLCYNERMDKWITRYTWTPLCSENINNIFYSLDRERAKILSYIYKNRNTKLGLRTEENQYVVQDDESIFSTKLSLEGYELTKNWDVNIDSVETSYLDENDVEHDVIFTGADVEKMFVVDKETTGGPYLKSKKWSEFGVWTEGTTTKNLFDLQFEDTPYKPLWYKINCTVSRTSDSGTDLGSISEVIGLVVSLKEIFNDNEKWGRLENKYLANGFYVHGKAGVFNEMDYNDQSFDNQILPTKWYDRQEPFEFEFVVSDQIGMHKIFNNLVIISNNVEPKSLEFEFVGDVYNFNKAGIYRNQQFGENLFDENNNKPIKQIYPKPDAYYQATQEFKNGRVIWDNNLNSYSIVVEQECKNISNPEYGRRLGNIQYKEDSWYMNIEPIQYQERFKVDNTEETQLGPIKSARIRDKYMKVRVKYTGDNLVIITALKTLLTLSYA